MSIKPRFPIGLQFVPYSDKQKRMHSILNIHTTRNEAGNVVKIEYLVSHDFCGQQITELMVDTKIARSLGNEGIKPFLSVDA